MTAFSFAASRRREDRGRHHHPRHRQGKAAGRRIVADARERMLRGVDILANA
jgi:hypothetical protein